MKNKTSINRKSAIKIMACNLMLAVVFLCGGCDNAHSKKYTLNYHQGDGWNRMSAAIECDSFKMINTKECIFWNNGMEGNIKSEEAILPNNVRW